MSSILQGVGAVLLLAALVTASAVMWSSLAGTAQWLLLWAFVIVCGLFAVGLARRLPATATALAFLTVAGAVVVASAGPALAPALHAAWYPPAITGALTVIAWVLGGVARVPWWRAVALFGLPLTVVLAWTAAVPLGTFSIPSEMGADACVLAASALVLLWLAWRLPPAVEQPMPWRGGLPGAARLVAGMAIGVGVYFLGIGCVRWLFTIDQLTYADRLPLVFAAGLLAIGVGALFGTRSAFAVGGLAGGALAMLTVAWSGTSMLAALLASLGFTVVLAGLAALQRWVWGQTAMRHMVGWALLAATITGLVPAVLMAGQSWAAGWTATASGLGAALVLVAHGLGIRLGSLVAGGLALAVMDWIVTWQSGYVGEQIEWLTVPIAAVLLATWFIARERRGLLTGFVSAPQIPQLVLVPAAVPSIVIGWFEQAGEIGEGVDPASAIIAAALLLAAGACAYFLRTSLVPSVAALATAVVGHFLIRGVADGWWLEGLTVPIAIGVAAVLAAHVRPRSWVAVREQVLRWPAVGVLAVSTVFAVATAESAVASEAFELSSPVDFWRGVVVVVLWVAFAAAWRVHHPVLAAGAAVSAVVVAWWMWVVAVTAWWQGAPLEAYTIATGVAAVAVVWAVLLARAELGLDGGALDARPPEIVPVRTHLSWVEVREQVLRWPAVAVLAVSTAFAVVTMFAALGARAFDLADPVDFWRGVVVVVLWAAFAAGWRVHQPVLAAGAAVSAVGVAWWMWVVAVRSWWPEAPLEAYTIATGVAVAGVLWAVLLARAELGLDGGGPDSHQHAPGKGTAGGTDAARAAGVAGAAGAAGATGAVGVAGATGAAGAAGGRAVAGFGGGLRVAALGGIVPVRTHLSWVEVRVRVLRWPAVGVLAASTLVALATMPATFALATIDLVPPVDFWRGVVVVVLWMVFAAVWRTHHPVLAAGSVTVAVVVAWWMWVVAVATSSPPALLELYTVPTGVAVAAVLWAVLLARAELGLDGGGPGAERRARAGGGPDARGGPGSGGGAHARGGAQAGGGAHARGGGGLGVTAGTRSGWGAASLGGIVPVRTRLSRAEVRARVLRWPAVGVLATSTLYAFATMQVTHTFPDIELVILLDLGRGLLVVLLWAALAGAWRIHQPVLAAVAATSAVSMAWWMWILAASALWSGAPLEAFTIPTGVAVAAVLWAMLLARAELGIDGGGPGSRGHAARAAGVPGAAGSAGAAGGARAPSGWQGQPNGMRGRFGDSWGLIGRGALGVLGGLGGINPVRTHLSWVEVRERVLRWPVMGVLAVSTVFAVATMSAALGARAFDLADPVDVWRGVVAVALWVVLAAAWRVHQPVLAAAAVVSAVGVAWWMWVVAVTAWWPGAPVEAYTGATGVALAAVAWTVLLARAELGLDGGAGAGQAGAGVGAGWGVGQLGGIHPVRTHLSWVEVRERVLRWPAVGVLAVSTVVALVAAPAAFGAQAFDLAVPLDFWRGVVVIVLWLAFAAIWRTHHPVLAAGAAAVAVGLAWSMWLAAVQAWWVDRPIEVYTVASAAALGAITWLVLHALARSGREVHLSSLLTVAPALTLALLPTAIVCSGKESESVRLGVVVLVGSALLIAGVLTRTAGLVYPALVALAVAVVPVLVFYSAKLPMWVPLSVAGVVLITVGARLEHVRRRGVAVVHWFEQLR